MTDRLCRDSICRISCSKLLDYLTLVTPLNATLNIKHFAVSMCTVKQFLFFNQNWQMVSNLLPNLNLQLESFEIIQHTWTILWRNTNTKAVFAFFFVVDTMYKLLYLINEKVQSVVKINGVTKLSSSFSISKGMNFSITPRSIFPR